MNDAQPNNSSVDQQDSNLLIEQEQMEHKIPFKLEPDDSKDQAAFTDHSKIEPDDDAECEALNLDGTTYRYDLHNYAYTLTNTDQATFLHQRRAS